MARHPRKVEETKAKPKFKASFGDDRAKVKGFTVPARRLVTLDSLHGIWQTMKGKKTVLLVIGPKEDWLGAIVRLRPPPDVEEGRIEEVKAALVAAGASRIKLEVRRGATLPTEAIDKGKPTRSSAREVVLQLVSEANSQDPAALSEIVERVMAEEGL